MTASPIGKGASRGWVSAGIPLRDVRLSPWWRSTVAPRVQRASPVISRVRALASAVSGAGWVSVIGGLAGLLLGWTQGWAELRVVGVTAVVCFLLALCWVLGSTDFDADFRLAHSRAVAGDVVPGSVGLTNRARRGLLPTRIELPVGKGRAHFDLPPVDKGATHEVLFEIPTSRRGVIRVGPVRSVRVDPLDLIRSETDWSGHLDLYVHPVTVALDHDHPGVLRDIEGVTTQDLSSNDVSFHALREYVPGDDRRNIHWLTTARTGRLMVRQFEETRRSHLLIVVSINQSDYASDEDLERAISVAGSLARNAMHHEREVTIVSSSGLIQGASALLMLDRLSELQALDEGAPFVDLVKHALREVPQASVCAMITGPASATHIRAADVSVPLGMTRFAVRCDATLTPQLRSLAGLRVLDLEDLSSLARLLRWVR